MSDTDSRYPDNSAIHARKAQGRRERAALSFGEKLDALDALRERAEPIIRAREERRRNMTQRRSD
jgi:hypothetical protein